MDRGDCGAGTLPPQSFPVFDGIVAYRKFFCYNLKSCFEFSGKDINT